MPDRLLDGLNEQQREAVTSESPVILCLAGAGSGKTRVLTHRMAYLHQEKRVGTSNMLALTFTRLAAKEMKERVMVLIGEREGKKLTVGTFHSFCVRVLREWGLYVGLESNFTIYDEEDREAVIRASIEELGYKEVRLQDVLANLASPAPDSAIAKIVAEYHNRLARNNAVDLDGLLTSTARLLSMLEPRMALHDQYRYVFVDEFQDTNWLQAEVTRLLAPEHLFVVGDDFQAIYGWRGADVRNILDFPKEHPSCHIIKLERNYRSTRQIVTAANTLIACNVHQTAKTLMSERDGDPVCYTPFENEEQEAETIGEAIKTQFDEREPDATWSDFAVLARTNRQADTVKLVLDRFHIPAKVVSHQDDVFRRPEIRRLLNFVEAAINLGDDMATRKAVNFPCQRLTELALNRVELRALNQSETLAKAIQQYDSDGAREFSDAMERLRQRLNEVSLASEVLASAAVISGLEASYLRQGLQNRMTDLTDMLGYINRWQTVQQGLGEATDIYAFFRWLRTRDIQERLLQEQTDAVRLMTVHAAKGLEFRVVFVVGMNQGVFPSKRSDDLEEERRLFYVAVTRAKDRLYLSRPQWGSVYPGGPLVGQPMSQFVTELQ